MIPEDIKLESVVLSVLEDLDAPHRDVLEKLILTSVARQGASYVISCYNIFEQGFAYLKKSPV